MSVTSDRRTSSTLTGAGSISTAEIKARLAVMFADDNADTPSPSLPPARELGSTASRSAPSATPGPSRGGPVP